MSSMTGCRDTVDAAYAGYAASPLLAEVHGPAYLNVGWHPAADPPAALVDRLLDRVDPPGPAVAVDVACGRAASTTRIARRWPAATVLGLDRNAALLPTVAPGGATVARADATALPVTGGVADLIVSVEAALHFATRKGFFAEAARVLRPGGQLLLTDLLVDPACPGWSTLVPPANAERDPDSYAAALTGAGLTVERIVDVTAHTWQPYADRLIAASTARSATAGAVITELLAARPVLGYIEVVARR